MLFILIACSLARQAITLEGPLARLMQDRCLVSMQPFLHFLGTIFDMPDAAWYPPLLSGRIYSNLSRMHRKATIPQAYLRTLTSPPSLYDIILARATTSDACILAVSRRKRSAVPFEATFSAGQAR